MKTVAALIAEASARLGDAGVDSPGLEAEALMAKAMGLDRAGVLARLREAPEAGQAETFQTYIKRRAAREPREYITGRQSFLDFEVQVSPAVLIPRPETQILAEEAIGFLKGRQGPLAADIGTGSGCIAIAVSRRVPGALVYAVDSSNEALSAARKNALANGAGKGIKFLHGDLFGPLRAVGLFADLDLVVSNPPYIPSGEIAGLQREVRFEPVSALDGGQDGLDVVRRIINEAPAFLKPGGRLIMEIGHDQAGRVLSAVEGERSLRFTKFLKDFAGIQRILVAEKEDIF